MSEENLAERLDRIEELLQLLVREVKPGVPEITTDENNYPDFESARHFHSAIDGAYSVVATLDQSNVDPGGRVSVYVYITGYGNINWNKLYLNLSAREFLVESQPPGDESEGPHDDTGKDEASSEIEEAFQERSIPGKAIVRMVKPQGLSSGPQGNVFGHGGFELQNRVIDSPTHTITFPHQIFAVVQRDESRPGFYNTTSEGQYADRDELEQLAGINDSTVEYKLNISDEARPGDYGILLTFTYYNGSQIKQDQAEATVHVNSWIEQHRTTIQRLAIVIPAGILALSGLRFLISLYTAAIVPWWGVALCIVAVSLTVAYVSQIIAVRLNLGNAKRWLSTRLSELN